MYYKDYYAIIWVFCDSLGGYFGAGINYFGDNEQRKKAFQSELTRHCKTFKTTVLNDNVKFDGIGISLIEKLSKTNSTSGKDLQVDITKIVLNGKFISWKCENVGNIFFTFYPDTTYLGEIFYRLSDQNLIYYKLSEPKIPKIINYINKHGQMLN